MQTTPFNDALEALGPGFLQEVRKRLAPVRDRFFLIPSRDMSEYVVRGDHIETKEGLIPTPPYLADPDLRNVAIELAELGIENGIDVNIVCEAEGRTFLHMCVLLDDLATARETAAPARAALKQTKLSARGPKKKAIYQARRKAWTAAGR